MVVELNLCNMNFYRFIPCEVLDSDCNVGGDSRLLGFGRLVNGHRCFWGACCTIFMLGNYSSIDTSPYSRRFESSIAFYIFQSSSLKVIILSTNDVDKSVVIWKTNWETTWRKGWGINNQLDVTYYFYFTYYLLSMFRTLICQSSGACDCVYGLPHRLSCSLFVVCWGLLRMMFGGVRIASWSTTVLQPAIESKCCVIWHSEDRASWYILIIKSTRSTSFSNLFLE